MEENNIIINKNITIIIILAIFIFVFLYLYWNLIIDYLLVANIIFTIFPGSYAIDNLVSCNTYWNYLSYITFSNQLIYTKEYNLSKLSPGYIIVSNHINVSDVALIRNKIDCYVVGKDSIISKEYPYLNMIDNIFFNNLNIIPYKRNCTKSGEEVKKNILLLTSNKKNVLIFPEGTSQKNSHNDILPFKKGLFHLAYEYDIKILPIVLYYTDENYGLDKETVFSPSKILRNKSTIYINFLNPLSPKKYSSVDIFTDTIHKRMNSVIKKHNSQLKKQTKNINFSN
jgi:1-acyl-sn-glycerol-3-phosphate acyltransferase